MVSSNLGDYKRTVTPVHFLAAKSDRKDCEKWLPLWMHLLDTAKVMDFLVNDWLPDHVKYFLCEDEEALSNTARCLGVMHDIGKATPLFQSRILQNIKDIGKLLATNGLPIPPLNRFDSYARSPHALAGEAILLNRNVTKGFAAIVGAHHGTPHPLDQPDWAQLQIDPYSATYANYYDDIRVHRKDLWKNTRSNLIDEVLNLCGGTLPDDHSTLFTVPQQVIWTGLLTIADWIASNENYFPLLSVEDEGSISLYPSRIEEALERLNLPQVWSPCCYTLPPEQFKTRFGFTPNRVQKSIVQTATSVNKLGLFILEASMGAGKTAAALATSELLASRTGCGGLFFGLPTQATSNGIFPRIEHWAASQAKDDQVIYSIKLAHGAAELNDNYQSIFHGTAITNEDNEDHENLLVHPWFEGRKQALLSDFVIGTVDQILMMALKQRHLMLRHLGLAGKIVIIDECHAYDAYMDQYLEQALAWLGAYDVPVILLSATLPYETRTRLVRAYQNKRQMGFSSLHKEPWMINRDYPLLTWTDGSEVKQKAISFDGAEQSVQIKRLADEALCDTLKNLLTDGGCAGVICNTVKRAQAFAEQIQAACPNEEVLVFHAGFTMEQRASLEQKLLTRLGKASIKETRDHLIVVGTQVMEQSLDVDFDVMVTDLCPADLLFQRMGRLHRHERERPRLLQDAVCYVLGAGEDQELEKGAVAIYGEYLLLRTKGILPNCFSIPKDISETVQNVYDPAYPINPEKEAAAFQDYQNKLHTLRQSANAFRLGAPSKSKRRRTTIAGLLDTAVPNDVKADAAVRYGADSIEVILLKFDSEAGLLSTLSNSPKYFAPDEALSDEEALIVARQKLRLPSAFSTSWCIDDTIDFLEKQSLQWVPLWLKHPLLNGELFLILDENNHAQINACEVSYDLHTGFHYERSNDEGH